MTKGLLPACCWPTPEKILQVEEIDCWGSGDRICRFTAIPNKEYRWKALANSY